MIHRTLPASIILDAFGKMPPIWKLAGPGDRWFGEGAVIGPDDNVDFQSAQTAFGLALLLDEWERAGNGIRRFWSGRLTDVMSMTWHQLQAHQLASLLAEMAERIEHIGLDARIRRALGWTVEAGTLATLERDDWDNMRPPCDRVWVLTAPDGTDCIFWEGGPNEPCDQHSRYMTVPGIGAPDMTTIEARRAIAAEVTP